MDFELLRQRPLSALYRMMPRACRVVFHARRLRNSKKRCCRFLLTVEWNRHIVPALPRKLWLSSEPGLLTESLTSLLKDSAAFSMRTKVCPKTSSKEKVYVFKAGFSSHPTTSFQPHLCRLALPRSFAGNSCR